MSFSVNAFRTNKPERDLILDNIVYSDVLVCPLPLSDGMKLAPTVLPCTFYTVAECSMDNVTCGIVMEQDLFGILAFIDLLIGIIGKTESRNAYSLDP